MDVERETVQTVVSTILQNATVSPNSIGGWRAEIPGLLGVWSNGDTKEEAMQYLRDVLEGGMHPPVEGLSEYMDTYGIMKTVAKQID